MPFDIFAKMPYNLSVGMKFGYRPYERSVAIGRSYIPNVSRKVKHGYWESTTRAGQSESVYIRGRRTAAFPRPGSQSAPSGF